MSEEYTLNDVVGLLKVLTTKVDDNTVKIDSNTVEIKNLTETVEGLSQTVEGLSQTVQSHTVKIDANTAEIKSLTETVNDVIEVVTAHSEKMDARMDRIEKTAVTKDDIKNMATKDDLARLQDNLYNQLLPVDKKTNLRVDTVVEVLDTQKVITPAQTAHLLTMEPFPRMAS